MSDSELFRACARLFMVGFDGVTPPKTLRALIDRNVFGGILFSRNIENEAQVRSLIASLKTKARRPFMMAVDQEGGRVARLRGGRFTNLPSMREIAARNSAPLCESVGALLACELRAVGFDWDFAPVLDVDTNPKNPVIGDRAFSRQPERVASLGLALARGLESNGVASCAKHFPGHGDTSTDSHLALPSLAFGAKRLEDIELHPFKAYSAARLAAVMTAHVIYRALDKKRPATMSPAALNGVLKGRLDFRGVVVSDDLEMKAIADHFSVERAAVEGVLAGVDLFLVCRHPDVQLAAIEAVYRAARAGHISRARLADAHARLDALEGRFSHASRQLGPPTGSAFHRRLANQVKKALGTTRTAGVDPTERLNAR